MSLTIADLRLLVTDDSITQRQYAIDLCDALNVKTVYEADNGLTALTLLQDHEVDVMLIDLEMPIMDGIELIRMLATKKLRINIIILSAKDPVLIASVGTMAEADGLHVLGTFQKPLQLDVLKCSLLRFIHDSHSKNLTPLPQTKVDITAVELGEALARGEVTLAYQPKLTVRGLLLRGVEGLARWRHPEKGMISPAEFIPLAERHGMMDLLTRTIFKQAFEHKKKWQQYGLRFNLALNLSPLSLVDIDLVNWIYELALHNDIAPADVTLEITENALIDELASAIHTLARLRLKGFHIAIDDYGTGFANAQQLSRVPATELKLDRSLIHRTAARPQQYTILASTVELAKNLNLTTVAEGVETEEDFQILKKLDIDFVQGFYFCKPLFADDLLQWIKKDLALLRQQHK